MSDQYQNPNPYGQDPSMPPPAGSQAPSQGKPSSPAHRRIADAIDPRKMTLDAATIERMVHAQVVARTQAQAATTVVLATIVSLITSAFSFVAALAWNSAIQQLLSENVNIDDKKTKVLGITISHGGAEAIYAVIVTFIAVVVVVILNRIARRYARKSALGTN